MWRSAQGKVQSAIKMLKIKVGLNHLETLVEEMKVKVSTKIKNKLNRISAFNGKRKSFYVLKKVGTK